MATVAGHPEAARALTKAINSLALIMPASKGARLRNRTKLNRLRAQANAGQSVVSAIPANIPAAKGSVVTTNATGVTPFRSTHQIVTGVTTGASYNNLALCPWSTASANGFGTSWDPKLLALYPQFMEYRVKRARVVYTGSAPTSKGGTIYMGSSVSPLTPLPAQEDYSSLARSKNFPVWTNNEPMDLLHDNDWHEIDDAITMYAQQTNASKTLHWAGLLHMRCVATSVTDVDVRLNLEIDFEFRGRNPSYEVGFSSLRRAALSSTTISGDKIKPVGTNFAPHELTYFATDVAIQKTVKTGYYFVVAATLTAGTTAGTAGSPVIAHYDSSDTDLVATKKLFAIWSGQQAASAAGEVVLNASATVPTGVTGGCTMALLSCTSGDKIGILDAEDTSPGTQVLPELCYWSIQRVSNTRALQLYQMVDSTATTLPL